MIPSPFILKTLKNLHSNLCLFCLLFLKNSSKSIWFLVVQQILQLLPGKGLFEVRAPASFSPETCDLAHAKSTHHVGKSHKIREEGKVRVAPLTILGLFGCRDITAGLGFHLHPQSWQERQRGAGPGAQGGDGEGLHLPHFPGPSPGTRRDYSAHSGFSAVPWVRAGFRTCLCLPTSLGHGQWMWQSETQFGSQMWCSGVDLLRPLWEIKSSC